MPDHFAALDQPRRPWLEAGALKDCFHRLSTMLHPDVPGTGDAARFAALNAAYATLRDPAARVRHLFEIEAPAPPALSPAPPAELADLFMRQAALHQRLTAFRAQRAAAANPLARALLAGEVASLRRDAESAQTHLDTAHEQRLSDLRALDARWSLRDPARYDQLAAVQRQLAFLGKWRAQLREALFQLD